MINLSFDDFCKVVNYPSVNKQSDSAFSAALKEAQLNYLMPIIGRDLLTAVIEFSNLEVYAWTTGTQSEIGRVYSYGGAYYKALTVNTAIPVIGTDWADSQMGLLYKEYVEPFMCYAIYYLLLLRSGVTLKGNNPLRSALTNEQASESTDLQRNLNHYQDLRGNLSNWLTSQLRTWGWVIDNVTYTSINGGVLFTRCLNSGGNCDCNLECRFNCLPQRNKTFRVI